MIALTAQVATTALLLTATSTAAAAPAATDPTPTTALAGAPATAVTTRADVDGDRRVDTIRVVRRSVNDEQYVFRITVETASGKRAIRDAIVPNYLDGSLVPADVWGGTAHLDGVRGAELLIEQGGNVGDAPWPHVYTWRNGRIVPAPAPGTGVSNPAWSIMDHPAMVAGYTFATVKGQRRVTAHSLTGHWDAQGETVTYRGTHTTYRWHRGAWQKIGTKRSGVLSESAALDHAGWNGVTWRS